jgi:tRNA(fMet)-specific endonuclease VapC
MAGRDVLLDTNAVIEIMSSKSDDALIRIAQTSRVYVSAITVGELYFGANKSAQFSANIRKLEDWLQNYNALPCDKTTAQIYGHIKYQLRVKGRPILENDVWIAAVALQYDLTLVTRDAHFSNVDTLLTQSC